MDEDLKITKEEIGRWFGIGFCLILIVVLTIYTADLKSRLDALERQTAEQQTINQSQIDGLSLNIETVRNEMSAELETQQKQIDEQADKITSVKSIVHNTNVALGRANKEIEEKESEIQELREELKK